MSGVLGPLRLINHHEHFAAHVARQLLQQPKLRTTCDKRLGVTLTAAEKNASSWTQLRVHRACCLEGYLCFIAKVCAVLRRMPGLNAVEVMQNL